MSAEHDSLVSWLVMNLEERGFQQIQADHLEGRPRPPAIGRHVPDVLAYSQGEPLIVGEAKTLDNLDNEQSVQQYHDYVNSGLAFELVVPDELREDARSLLRELGLYPHPNLSIR